MAVLDIPTTPFIFFTGKGGVGKTSLACATALALADAGENTLIVSTDPASNLDELFGQTLSGEPSAIPSVPNLFALNIDPEAAAVRYRDRALAPYRGVLPDSAIRSIEEGLSGACTTEIAAFDEFVALISDTSMSGRFDRIVFDTAPTGHTLRLLALPAAWTEFSETNVRGASCLGPVSALKRQVQTYRTAVKNLGNKDLTTVALVARPDVSSLAEADRASRELSDLGIKNQAFILNGVFEPGPTNDSIANAFADRQRAAIAGMGRDISGLPRSTVPLLTQTVSSLAGVRALLRPVVSPSDQHPFEVPPNIGLDSLIDEIELAGNGIVMTMGKGGVGKTTIATAIAAELARRGHATVLTTTDPAAQKLGSAEVSPNLSVERIDPKVATKRYAESIICSAGEELDSDGHALLEEELRSPCTEEIAVFRAFADTVARGEDAFVVIDTAPTGHTILLLDAAQAYHREVSRSLAQTPDSVTELLPRLRDPNFTKVIVIALPEPTPVHEAAALAADLRRAGIEPFAAVINQSLAASETRDPLLSAKAAQEQASIVEAQSLARRFAVLPWSVSGVAVRPPTLA